MFGDENWYDGWKGLWDIDEPSDEEDFIDIPEKNDIEYEIIEEEIEE